MLIRVVRMEFRNDKIDDFKEIFYQSKPDIERFHGCNKVSLYVDSTDDSVYYTHSEWDSEDALNNYRNSDFFKATWSKTKLLFSGPPCAYSLVSP